jgi:electron-transferring-flavoprotein dehydrogenase
VTGGRVPFADHPTDRDADQDLIRTDRAASYPAPDGKLTFDKLSSVYLSGNRTRDDQPNHIRVQTEVPRALAEMWARMCPAKVYEVDPAEGGRRASEGEGERAGGTEGEPGGTGGERVKLVVTPSNCVQCGAITAKGGRLTPPEGGSGPEYSLT